MDKFDIEKFKNTNITIDIHDTIELLESNFNLLYANCVNNELQVKFLTHQNIDIIYSVIIECHKNGYNFKLCKDNNFKYSLNELININDNNNCVYYFTQNIDISKRIEFTLYGIVDDIRLDEILTNGLILGNYYRHIFYDSIDTCKNIIKNKNIWCPQLDEIYIAGPEIVKGNLCILEIKIPNDNILTFYKNDNFYYTYDNIAPQYITAKEKL